LHELLTAELPVGVHTVTATVPATCGGVVAVICVDELTVKSPRRGRRT
jgi:hypothetical protein